MIEFTIRSMRQAFKGGKTQWEDTKKTVVSTESKELTELLGDIKTAVQNLCVITAQLNETLTPKQVPDKLNELYNEYKEKENPNEL